MNKKDFIDFGIDVSSTNGDQVYTLCPECSASRRKKKVKCLSVNMTEGIWNCHHCGWTGSLLSGNDWKDKIPHWNKPKLVVRPKDFQVSLEPSVVEWFKARGISRQTLEDNKVSYRSVYMPQVEDFVTSIGFPYYRDDELINVKYRDKDKNFRLEAGAERIFYGLDHIDNDQVIIVEGEVDKLSMYETGLKSCISVPDGAPSHNSTDYSSKFDFLKEERLSDVKKFVLCVDSDPAGLRLEEELSRRLGRDRCNKATLPEDCKDANDVLRKYGMVPLAECIAEAKPYPIEGTYNSNDLSESIDRLYDTGVDKGVSTGWMGLDKLYMIRPGILSVVTGIPSSGKSNWIDAMMVNIADEHGWNFAIFSPENQPLEDHMARVLEKYVGSPFMDGPNMRMSREELADGKSWLANHFTWILPNDDKQWTLDIILDAAKRLILTKGIRGLVIDPWNEIEHDRDDRQTETEYISMSLKRIRQFARRYGIHIWVVAHPAKMYRDKQGKIPVPTPYDISGSARWRDKSDNCVTIWRDLSDNDNIIVQIHVQKVRFRQDGRIGVGELSYNWLVGTYHEPMEAAREIPSVVAY